MFIALRLEIILHCVISILVLTINKSKNFNKVFAAGGKLDGLSQTWQMANMFGNAIPGNVSTETAIDEIYEAKKSL